MSTAVILAGGKSRRMGRDKLTLRFGELTLLESSVRRFSKKFDKVYLSVSDANRYPDVSAEHVEDIYKNCGPMAGLHAALTRAEDDGVFLVAADLPFATADAALRVMELAGSNDACIALNEGGRLEPLFGYYRKTLLKRAGESLAAGKYKMIELFNGSAIKTVTPAELGSLWSNDLFLNVNFPDDYEKIIRQSCRR